MNSIRHLLRLVLLILGLAILFGIVNHYGFDMVMATLRYAQGWWILGGVGCYFFALLLRSWKWHNLLLVSTPGARMRDALALFVLNQTLGNLTPGRAGEMAAPFMIRQRTKSSVGGAFSVLVVDRFLELNFLLLLMILAMIYFLSSGAFPGMVTRGSSVIILFLFLLVALIGSLFFSEQVSKIVLNGAISSSKRLRLSFVYKIFLKVEQEADSFYRAMKAYRLAGILPILVVLTGGAWLLEILSFFLLVNSVGRIPFLLVAASQIISFGAGLMSLVPNGIGVTALSFVFLVSLMGFSGVVATTGALLGTILNFGLVILLAAIFSLRAPQVVTVPEENP